MSNRVVFFMMRIVLEIRVLLFLLSRFLQVQHLGPSISPIFLAQVSQPLLPRFPHSPVSDSAAWETPFACLASPFTLLRQPSRIPLLAKFRFSASLFLAFLLRALRWCRRCAWRILPVKGGAPCCFSECVPPGLEPRSVSSLCKYRENVWIPMPGLPQKNEFWP